LKDVINFWNIKKYMNAHGMSYTDAQKLGTDDKFHHIDEVPFLKRRFKRFGAHVMAPLEMASIEGMTAWMHKTTAPENCVPQLWNTLRLELVYHGREEYERVISAVRNAQYDWCDRRRVPRPTLQSDFDLDLATWLSKL